MGSISFIVDEAETSISPHCWIYSGHPLSPLTSVEAFITIKMSTTSSPNKVIICSTEGALATPLSGELQQINAAIYLKRPINQEHLTGKRQSPLT